MTGRPAPIDALFLVDELEGPYDRQRFLRQVSGDPADWESLDPDLAAPRPLPRPEGH